MKTKDNNAAQFTAQSNEWSEGETDQSIYAMGNYDDPEENTEEETEEEEEDQKGDWGHVDPADTNSPFPDPMDPSAPGSAV